MAEVRRSIFRSRRMAVVFLLGFSSGLPLMLVGQTLQQWAIDAKVDIKALAAFTLIKLPSNFKWVWAPLLDRYPLPFLGRRRGWLITLQITLVLGLTVMASLDAATNLAALVTAAVLVSFVSMSQDIIVDAYNVEVLEPDERAAGSAVYVMGYRTAMLISGSLTLIMADHMSWQIVYGTMAALMLVGVFATLLAEEPSVTRPPRTFMQSVYRPFLELWQRYRLHAIVILLFCATYKFGEQFAQAVSQPFYREAIGFTKTEIGVLSKAVAFVAFGLGGAFGGTLVARYGLRKMLVAFGILQAATHAGYLLLAYVGHDLTVYGITLFVENLSFAMATAAFTGAQYSFCTPGVAAMQMALLTSLTGLGQNLFGVYAGRLVAAHGYVTFYEITIAMGVPGLVLAWFANAPRGSASAPSTTSPA
jgi:PAT family beta-lactamase induction signal transducer AmpG